MARPERLLGLRPRPFGAAVAMRRRCLAPAALRLELPTAWVVVSKPIANVWFLNIDYWNARCPFCLTMQDDA